MLPDIARPNKLLHVSGLGQYAGPLLTRSATDMHPEEFRCEVVWSGTIEAQWQKREQRRPTLEPEDVLPPEEPKDDGRPVAETILAILKNATEPLPRHRIRTISGFGAAVVDNAMYRLAANDLVVSGLLPNVNRLPGQKKWTRVYYLPAKAKAA